MDPVPILIAAGAGLVALAFVAMLVAMHAGVPRTVRASLGRGAP